MAASYDLSRLGSYEFEHLVNQLALRVLGSGHSSFGPGADGGRDGYFEGSAPYPSATESWAGKWYIQAKFLAPRLGVDPQKWLLGEIKRELDSFADRSRDRKWPDIWIVATNVDPSGVPETGAFDRALKLVRKARPKLAPRFHIWGGKKILDLLNEHRNVQTYFLDFLTPGHVLRELYQHLSGRYAGADKILQYLLVRQFGEQRNTKLQQAGSRSDTRPGVHKLFIDVPIRARDTGSTAMALRELARASANSLRPSLGNLEGANWRKWRREPSRARVWFLRGGPGRGKTTIGQFFSQVHRAAWIQHDPAKFPVRDEHRDLVREVEDVAKAGGYWPTAPRIPLQIDLKEFASWLSSRQRGQPKGILSFTAERLTEEVEREVSVSSIEELFRGRRWFISFDGLDEVPQDSKEVVANHVLTLLDEIVLEVDCDLLAICTSRPQGYAGQFDRIDGPTLDLIDLNWAQALRCAEPLLAFERTSAEARDAMAVLTESIKSPAVQQLMTTPLQSHIMAIVVRDGGRPPERRWNLFKTFYEVIRKREANKNFAEKDLVRLLTEEELLLKTIHNRLGFVLHSRTEQSSGAQGFLKRQEFADLVRSAVVQIKNRDIEKTVQLVMTATTDRLVLVNTPETGDQVRFDVRQLQEFFAAEFVHEGVEVPKLEERLKTIAADAHWYEVVQFVISALVELGKRTELSLANQILIGLNTGTGSEADRIVLGRAAIGARVVSRLLRDGVLDQDRRNRVLFSPAFEPFGSATAAHSLSAFAGFRHLESRAWLFETLFNHLDTKTEPENVGAAVLLSMMITDDEPQIERLKDYLLKCSPPYANYVVTTCLQEFYSPDESFRHVPKWWWELLFLYVKRTNWAEYFPNAIEILSAAQRGKGGIPGARRAALKRPEIAAVKLFDGMWGLPEHESEVESGVARFVYFDRDWTILRHGPIAFPNIDAEQLAASPGLFGIVGFILLFAGNPTAATLRAAANKIRHEWTQVQQHLPDSKLTAMLPISSEYPISEQLSLLSNINEVQFGALLNEQRLGDWVLPRPARTAINTTVNPTGDWDRLSQDRPVTAINLQLQQAGIARHPEVSVYGSLPSPEAFLRTVEKYPAILRPWFWAWEEIKGRFKDANVQRIEAAYNQALTTPEGLAPRDRWFYFSNVDAKPFECRLPRDRGALPLVLKTALTALTRRDAREELSKPEQIIDRVKRVVAISIADPQQLVGVIDDATSTTQIRAAAIGLSLLHPALTPSCATAHSQMCCLGYENIPHWIATAIGRMVCLVFPPWHPDGMKVLAAILEVIRMDYDARDLILRALAGWRETSLAPVTTARFDELWLGQ